MDDLISRQAAIDTFRMNCYPIRYNYNSIEKGMTITGIKQVLDELPPAQSEIIRCKDCNHFYKDNLNQWCFRGKYGVKEDDFCSRAERKTNE